MSPEEPKQFVREELTGGTLSPIAPVWSQDGSMVLVAVGTVVKVYSATTSALLALLNGHSAPITSLFLHPTNHLQLYTTSEDATLRLWDFQDAVQLAVWDFAVPLQAGRPLPGSDRLLLVADLPPTHAFSSVILPSPGAAPASQPMTAASTFTTTAAAASILPGSGRNSKLRIPPEAVLVFQPVLTAGRPANWSPATIGDKERKKTACAALGALTTLLYRMWPVDGLTATASGSHVASISRRTLYVWSMSGAFLKRYPAAEKLTTLAVHPSQTVFATGDRKGVITLWYGMDSQDAKRVVTSTLHWHAHAVSSLAFSSSDGSYLYSGGEEAVLVSWHWESNSKTFLPRLGAPLVGISVSPDATVFALAGADNTIRMVNAMSLKIASKIEGLKVGGNGVDASVLGMTVNPATGAVAVAGSPSSVQLYDFVTDRAVTEVDVAPRNVVSRRQEKTVQTVTVESVDFSAGGDWMATLDRRMDDHTSEVHVLKFWSYSQQAKSFVLHTRIESPHKSQVSALAFSPVGLVAVTASHDGKFKLWATSQGEDTKSMATGATISGNLSWVCRSVGYYRDHLARAAAWSGDGAVLAVAYGQVVTLWDAESTTLLSTLVGGPPSDPVRKLGWAGMGPMLAASSGRMLTVWNTLSGSVQYSIAFSSPLTRLATAPHCDMFAISGSVPASGEGESASGYVAMLPSTSATPVGRWSVDGGATGLVWAAASETSFDTLGPLAPPPSLLFSVAGGRTFRVRPVAAESVAQKRNQARTQSRQQKPVASSDNALDSGWSNVFGALPTAAAVEKKKNKKNKRGKKGGADAAEPEAPAFAPPAGYKRAVAGALFDGPSHMLPAPSSLFRPFMSALMRSAMTVTSSGLTAEQQSNGAVSNGAANGHVIGMAVEDEEEQQSEAARKQAAADAAVVAAKAELARVGSSSRALDPSVAAGGGFAAVFASSKAPTLDNEPVPAELAAATPSKGSNGAAKGDRRSTASSKSSSKTPKKDVVMTEASPASSKKGRRKSGSRS